MESDLSYRIQAGLQLETIESTNSFLVETSYNSDIDDRIRKDIESKFKRSKVNSLYKFPRLTQKPVTNKKLSMKSIENPKKNTPVYRSTKSLLYPYATERKELEMGTPQTKKCSVSQKNIGKKKNCVHVRVLSTKNLPKEKSSDSKSPAQKKSFVGIYSQKHLCNPGISKILNNIHPAKLEGGLTNRMYTMRLRRINNDSKDFIKIIQ